MDANLKEMGTAQLSTAWGLQETIYLCVIVVGAEEGDIRLKKKNTKTKKAREWLDNSIEMGKDAWGRMPEGEK